MIARSAPYPSTKPSGTTLGDVPDHWEMRKLRQLLRSVTARNRPDWPLLSVVREKGVILRNVSSREENRNYIPDDLTNYKVVRSGQFAMNKMKAWQGSYGVSPHDGIVSPAYFVFDLDGVDAAFFNAAIRSQAYVHFFAAASDGIRIGQWDLSRSRMQDIPFVVPPLEEQAAIVRYLRHMDRRIRHFVRAKRKLVALLDEQERVLIHQAVTRGLNSKVRLKPSGVEWLGEVPAHWPVFSLGAASASIQTGPFGSQLHSSEYVSGGIPVVNPSHMRGGLISADPEVAVSADRAQDLERHQLQVGDVVVARRGELGRCALVVAGQEGWLCGTGSLRIRPRRDLFDSTYLVQLFGSSGVRDMLSLSSVGATMDNLNASMMARLRLPVPPLPEQCSIVQWVSRASALTRLASAQAKREISWLLELRARLLADVVTGKLDVRDAAAQLPNEIDEEEALDDSERLAEDEESGEGPSETPLEEVGDEP